MHSLSGQCDITAKPRGREGVAVFPFEDELLLYDPAAHEAIYLNASACALWRNVQNSFHGQSPDDLSRADNELLGSPLDGRPTGAAVVVIRALKDQGWVPSCDARLCDVPQPERDVGSSADSDVHTTSARKGHSQGRSS